MYCGKCGKKVPDGYDYCMYCGAKVENQIQKSIGDAYNPTTLDRHKTHFAKRKKIITISVVAVVFIGILVSYLLLISPIAPLSEDESRTLEASEKIQDKLAYENSIKIYNAFISNEPKTSIYFGCQYRVFLEFGIIDSNGKITTKKAVFVHMIDGTTYIGSDDSQDEESKKYYILSEGDVYGISGFVKPSGTFNHLSNFQVWKIQAHI